MKSRIQSLFSIGVLVLLAGLTFWLERVTQVEEPRGDGKQRHDPDYVAEGFTVRGFGPRGSLENTLSAARMVHFPDDDTTVMTQPRIASFKNARAIRMSADQALVGADSRVVTLVDSVRVVREATRSDPETVFTTRVLTVYPDDEVFHTDAPVLVAQGRSVLRGTHLEADNKTGLVRLSGVAASIESKRNRKP